MVTLFCLLEINELCRSSLAEYLSNSWNVMDWLNYVIFFIVYSYVQEFYAAIDETPEHSGCQSYMCRDVGYFDDWKVMSNFRNLKIFISLCVCIQLLKVLKFASELVPKMGLATSVLKKCVIDLLFFGVTFIISVRM
mmetsp:Transcript_659/g.1374  ORF Transcript_659/g.1374 Transcript_659/m.1374 type:complete len:137 (-) Transcript_659:8-418(-)